MEKENTENGLPEGHNRNSIDIDAILLPKKEAPPSTQRVNAGVLLEQEQSATLLKPEGNSLKTSGAQAEVGEKSPGGGGQIAQQFGDKDFSKQLPPESEVPSLQTYKDDIQKLIKKDNVSVVTIAAAEAGRRDVAVPGAAPAHKPEISLSKVVMIVGGVLLTLGALALVAYFFRPTPSVPIQDTLPAPFIAIDATTVVLVGVAPTRSDIVTHVQDAKTTPTLTLGLVGRLLPVTATQEGGTQTILSAQTFLSLLAPHIPPDLLRTIEPTFLLGVHIFDQVQPFLIFKVDSYEQAYSGMLSWEGSMRQDLLPLFEYTPRPHIPEEGLGADSTGSTTPVLLPSGFGDRIVANHDARVLQNNTSDIYFLWTFLDRNTLVITTNQNTLVEIITRAKETSITALPQ